MTNPKTRKTGTAPVGQKEDAAIAAEAAAGAAARRRLQMLAMSATAQTQLLDQRDADAQCIVPNWLQQAAEATTADDEDEDDTSTASTATKHELEEQQLATRAGDNEDEEDEVNSNSSFSLQECINEFRARRIRRISTQSREAPLTHMVDCAAGAGKTAIAVEDYLNPADADLINQNRSNKEHERKCKPCQNGFCYCFTSDSGDGGGCAAAARGAHVRQARRSRKSEGSQWPPHHSLHTATEKEKCCQSAPVHMKSTQQPHKQRQTQKQPQKQPTQSKTLVMNAPQQQLTAISRLETSAADAPLIHIIQELHDNCVISEVRVNKHKMLAQQRHRSRSLSAKLSPKKTHFHGVSPRRTHSPIECRAATKLASTATTIKKQLPSAPALDQISELHSTSSADAGFVYSSPLNSSSKSADSPRYKHKAAAGGRLLQKRLSQTHHIQFKPRNLSVPPPKPPRSSLNWEEKSSVSSLASTSPSVREAERILDDFLRQQGVQVPGETPPQTLQKQPQLRKSSKKNHVTPRETGGGGGSKQLATHALRKSYPLTRVNEKLRPVSKPLPSCPSLSDIEDVLQVKSTGHYGHNIAKQYAPVKEFSIGWKEPKIAEMLNYDANGNRKQFKSRGTQAEPQCSIGWQLPPKLDLDTVDGGVRHNLAANMEQKQTPVKTRLFSSSYKTQKARDSQKFILAEQWRNLSPWTQHKRRSAAATSRQPKSNLKSNSMTRNFLQSSRKKILRLVSPKKDNKERGDFVARKTPLRCTVAVQTSHEDLRGTYENSSTPQSPPGSYHSAVQTSQQSSSTLGTTQTPRVSPETRLSAGTQFDFSRTVQSPPKKAPRAATQRRLDFPLNGADAGAGGDGFSRVAPQADTGLTGALKAAAMTTTYRSFHSDLDQDVTLSKMNYILGNIRAKLEASDEHAIRTFQEIERREQRSAGFDSIDGPHRRPDSRIRLQHNVSPRQLPVRHASQEPIYSEIEEDSIHISGSPQHENKTGIQHFPAARNPEALYAKVQKTPKVQAAPKRSEIFLENLCRGEIIVESGELDRLEKVENQSCALQLNAKQANTSTFSSMPADTVSYELPHAADVVLDTDSASNSNAAGSQLDLQTIASPHTHNQSTPKKKTQTFLTKLFLDEQQQLELDLSNQTESLCSPHVLQLSQSNSCPSTPHRLAPAANQAAPERAHAASLNEVYTYNNTIGRCDVSTATNNNNNNTECSNPLSTSTCTRYKRLKDALRRSLRRSKKFVRNETKRLSSSLSFPTPHSASKAQSSGDRPHHQSSDGAAGSNDSSFNLDTLFALEDERAPVQQQLAKAVSICRQLPDLEISPEMVEAERLLLYSTLRREARKQQLSLVQVRPSQQRQQQQRTRRFYIDAMCLPVKADASQDLFFNYFYICTFECGGVIRSTQSAECHNYEAIFRDCGIEFDCELKEPQEEEQAAVQCQIFMLRLRKVSTLSLEPRKSNVKLPSNVLTPSPTSSSNSSGEQIVSRFRLHASFKLHARDFTPYEYVESASKQTEQLCLRAARSCNIPLTRRTRSTNLSRQIVLNGRAEARFPKQRHAGFLNVQDPHTMHNWNRRWCTLEGLQLRVWQDEPDEQLEQQPVLCLELHGSTQTSPLAAAPRELCARPRSFCLQCTISGNKAGVELEPATAAVFFAADTQDELNIWLLQLNAVLRFVEQWMR